MQVTHNNATTTTTTTRDGEKEEVLWCVARIRSRLLRQTGKDENFRVYFLVMKPMRFPPLRIAAFAKLIKVHEHPRVQANSFFTSWATSLISVVASNSYVFRLCKQQITYEKIKYLRERGCGIENFVKLNLHFVRFKLFVRGSGAWMMSQFNQCFYSYNFSWFMSIFFYNWNDITEVFTPLNAFSSSARI